MPTMPNTPSPVEYVTKADLQQLRLELRGDLAELKADLAERLLRLEERQAARDSSLHKTIITTLLAQLAMFGTLVTVLKLFG